MRTDSPLRFLMRFFRGSILISLASILLSTAAILLGVGLIGTSAYLISYAALQPSISVLNIPIVGVRFFGISKSIFRYLERLASHEVNFRILAGLRIWIYQHLIPRIPFRETSERTGDLIHRAVDDVEVLEYFFIRVINPPITAWVTTGVVGILLGSLHPNLLWVYLFLTWTSILLSLVVAYIISSISSRSILDKQAALHANLVDYLDNFPDLIVNGATGSQMAFVRNAETDYNNAQIRSAWGNAMVNGLTAFLTHGSMLVMLGAGILLVQQGALDGMLLAVTVLVTLVSYDAIQPLPLAAQQAYLSGQAAQRIMNITDQSEMHPPIRSIVADHGQDVLADKHEALRGLIRLENVTFRYHPDDEKVLDGINLNILPGRKIAVVGPSGAGKTTLARLLLKFWEPESGRILLDGKSYSIWPEQEIRSQIGYSGPDPFFVNGSLRENMELIRPGITDEEIEEVLKQVHLTGWYQTLPEGLDTSVGERGFRMSEGERKRLDLARLFLLNRAVWILDEPFANLDVESREYLKSSILTFSHQKTVLVITHQLSDLDWTDEIVVLDRGSVIEQGTWKSLLYTKSQFQAMLALQRRIIPVDQA